MPTTSTTSPTWTTPTTSEIQTTSRTESTSKSSESKSSANSITKEIERDETQDGMDICEDETDPKQLMKIPYRLENEAYSDKEDPDDDGRNLRPKENRKRLRKWFGFEIKVKKADLKELPEKLFWKKRLRPLGMEEEIKDTLIQDGEGLYLFLIAVTPRWKARWVYLFFKFHKYICESTKLITSCGLLSDLWCNTSGRDKWKQKKEIWGRLFNNVTVSNKTPGSKNCFHQNKNKSKLGGWKAPRVPPGDLLSPYCNIVLVEEVKEGSETWYLISTEEAEIPSSLIHHRAVLVQTGPQNERPSVLLMEFQKPDWDELKNFPPLFSLTK